MKNEVKDMEIRHEIAKALYQLGMPSSSGEYSYLYEAVLAVVKDPDMTFALSLSTITTIAFTAKMNSSLASLTSSTNGTPRPQVTRSEPHFRAKPREVNASQQVRLTDISRIPITQDTSYPIPIPRISLYESSKNFSRIQISKR